MTLPDILSVERGRALPGLLLRPLAWLPSAMVNQSLAGALTQLFSASIREGELAFLTGRVLRIEIEDADLRINLGFDGLRLQTFRDAVPADVQIRGPAYEFALLVTRQEDPDTLFFQRRLRVEGSTELGLHVKNFIDAWEPPAAVRVLERLGGQLLARLERSAPKQSHRQQTRSGAS